jgi:hypothetical protein
MERKEVWLEFVSEDPGQRGLSGHLCVCRLGPLGRKLIEVTVRIIHCDLLGFSRQKGLYKPATQPRSSPCSWFLKVSVLKTKGAILLSVSRALKMQASGYRVPGLPCGGQICLAGYLQTALEDPYLEKCPTPCCLLQQSDQHLCITVEANFEIFRTQILNQEESRQFAPAPSQRGESCGNSWGHFSCPNWGGGCYWCLSQNSWQTRAGQPPEQRSTRPMTSMMHGTSETVYLLAVRA